MPIILSIETSTPACSVAVHRDHVLLGVQELFTEKSHSTHLAVLIKQLVENCQLKMQDLDAVAVSKGPGSYTGLRIGVATAKGLCYGLNLPLVGINTLEAMAHQFSTIPPGIDYLCPMIDARRMEVYCTILGYDLKVLSDTQSVVVNEESFQEWRVRGNVLFFGNGSDKCREILNGSSSFFVSGIAPSAKTVGLLGGKKFDEGQVEDLAYFEPFYLKEFRTTTPKSKTGI